MITLQFKDATEALEISVWPNESQIYWKQYGRKRCALILVPWDADDECDPATLYEERSDLVEIETLLCQYGKRSFIKAVIRCDEIAKRFTAANMTDLLCRINAFMVEHFGIVPTEHMKASTSHIPSEPCTVGRIVWSPA